MVKKTSFEKTFDSFLGILDKREKKVSGLVSSILSELQAIALALKCVPSSCAVDLFSDSQVALDVYKLESLLAFKSHLDISGNECTDDFVKDVALFTWHLPHLIKIGSGSWVLAADLHDGVDWSKSSLVWHPDSHLAAGFTSVHTASLQTYFIKSLYYQLPVAVHKCLYDRCYPSVVCLFCDDVEFSDHVFVCPFDAAGCAQLLNLHVSFWETWFGLSQSTSCVSQLLVSCFSDATISTTLYKSFVFDNWYREFFSVFKDAKIVALNIVCFVCKFCFTFSFMERNRLIPYDDSILALVSGLLMVLSAGVIRLLSIVKAFGVGFGFRKPCLFFSGIGDFVSVKIDA
ncbi:hypothetical protein G9A89_022904 [Geosiphon pyriformis]|nr:hypothetical protein G9A89_022904 [Geosiphon pyriformis]